jgi:hypothetical protein
MAYISDTSHKPLDLKLDTLQGSERNRPHSENGGAVSHAHGDYLTSSPRISHSPAAGQPPQDQIANHVPTPPIDVPVPENENAERPSAQYNGASPDPSLFDDFIRNRSTSISFNSKVKLDTGDQHTLGESVKKVENGNGQLLEKVAGRSRVRGRSLFQELSEQLRSPAGRRHSESHRLDYDPLTGELLPDHPRNYRTQGGAQEDLRQLHIGEARHPLLQATVDALAGESSVPRLTSFTSESTMSPVIEEVQTPQESHEYVFSLRSVRPPMHAKSFDESTNPWPVSGDENILRAESYTFGRHGSLRNVMRQKDRRSTSSSYSPASKFLNQWINDDAPPEPDDEGQSLGDRYVLGKKIGFGGFSTVKEATTFENGRKITRAVKIVRKVVSGKTEHENDEVQAEFEHEVSLWRCLHHKNILPLIAVYDTNFATFCITRLHTSGTLFDLIRKNRRGLTAPVAKRYAYQLASALRYLHNDARVVHRDIKLENCLLDMSDPETAQLGGNVVLCDFGMAEFMTSDHRDQSPDPYEAAADRPPRRNIGPSESSTSVGSFAGSLQYASPELINSPGGMLDPVTDIWAFGVVLFALLVGDLPFQHALQHRVTIMILSGDYSKDALLRINDSSQEEKDDAAELIQNCLQTDVDERWTISDILGCRWLRDVKDEADEGSEGGWIL